MQMHRCPRVAHDVRPLHRSGAGKEIRRQVREEGRRGGTRHELKSIQFVTRLSMESAAHPEKCARGPVETVWGGRGLDVAATERPGLKFRDGVVSCSFQLVQGWRRYFRGDVSTMYNQGRAESIHFSNESYTQRLIYGMRCLRCGHG